MAQTIAQKILAEHLVEGHLRLGEEVGLRIDQTLTQDATGTMAYLQFEAMGRVRYRQRGDVTRKHFVVVLLRFFISCHIKTLGIRPNFNDGAGPKSHAVQVSG
jgi:aconitase A